MDDHLTVAGDGGTRWFSHVEAEAGGDSAVLDDNLVPVRPPEAVGVQWSDLRARCGRRCGDIYPKVVLQNDSLEQKRYGRSA